MIIDYRPNSTEPCSPLRLLPLTIVRMVAADLGEGRRTHMPRTANNADALLADLTTRLERLVAQARKEGREDALQEVRQLVAGGGATKARGRPRTAAKTPAKRGKKRKNPWANLTPKERLKRINAMRKGRGLPLKRKL